MSARPRVWLVESAPRVTGAVKSLSAVVRALRNDFDFSLVGSSEAVRAELGVELQRFEFAAPRKSELLSYGPRVLWQAARFARLANAARPDIVHVNDLTNIVPLVSRWLGARFKLVYHLRLLPTSYIGPVFRPLSRLILRHADRAVCVSNAVMNALPKAHRVSMVPNGLPVSVVADGLAITDEEADGTGAGGPLEVLYVSHFHPGKGQDLAVEAFARAREKLPALKLLFAGSEETAPEFARRVRERASSLGDAVTFLGPVKDTRALLRRAAIVLNLSESESFSMVVLEAMMAGRAIIASRSGGPEELLSDAASGRLVPNRDVAAATDALVELGASAALRNELGQHARRVAVERYDVRHTSAQLAGIYRELLA